MLFNIYIYDGIITQLVGFELLNNPMVASEVGRL